MIHPATVDYIDECMLIAKSRFQRLTTECKEMNRRLTTDAKIVLERAGYIIYEGPGYILASNCPGPVRLQIENETVDNSEVVKLLAARGFDEFGYHR